MTPVKAVLFDFDGTVSTLRAGWEDIMRPFMIASIAGDKAMTAEQEQALEREVEAYIDQSTGIQTIYQMEWLAERVREQGWSERVLDRWAYKAIYNERLLARVNERVRLLSEGKRKAEDFLIKGAADFIRELHGRGIAMYVASGTDHPDVVREAEVLGIAPFLTEIAGAPVGRAECSKEKVLQELMRNNGLRGRELAVIGDGKVEIRLGKEAGAVALGLASDEDRREGLHPAKRARLEAAGADWIAGDFGRPDEWLSRLGL